MAFSKKNELIDSRILCEITEIGSDQKEIDVIFIMLNPGSSKPFENVFNNLTQIKSDPTMHQIMRIMMESKFKKCSIVNLSSYRNAKQKEFEKEMNAGNIDNYLLKLKNIENVKYIIFAWGELKNKQLITLANNIKTKYPKAIYCLNEKSKSIKHPLPPNYEKQHTWVTEICKQIKLTLLCHILK